ncbi:MAG: sigma 54-interacting transcriptional regulator [Polyangiales bacterium]
METLKLYRGEQLLAQVALGERPVELGRGQSCDLVVDDPELAERHFLALRRLGTVIAYDVSAGRGGKPRPLPLGKRVAVGRDHSLLREHEAEHHAHTGLQRGTESLPSERSPRRDLSLLVGRGTDARRMRIGERPLHLGRGADNDLVLADRAASLRHCRLEPSGAELLLRDLGSCNGTFVNEVRVERALVGAGAAIRVGRTELRLIEQDARGRVAGTDLVARAPAMLSVLADAQRAADLPWPVLVLGESGTGKEGIAQLVHARGPRQSRPLVTLNAGGVPAELIESELFGHERGAFTGANNARRGVFEQAEGGTLFLDEIGELPLPLQARLLRVLETGEVRRVGGESARKLEVRVVCATHRDLREMVADGRFRQDLYFRIARIVLTVPPLRHRPEDLLALSRHFLGELEPWVGRRALTPEAEALLRVYPWPGNVRELRNVLCAAAVASPTSSVEAQAIEQAIARLGGAGLSRAQASTDGLRQVVEQYGGNLAAAARALGIARTTLRDRLRS